MSSTGTVHPSLMRRMACWFGTTSCGEGLERGHCVFLCFLL